MRGGKSQGKHVETDLFLQLFRTGSTLCLHRCTARHSDSASGRHEEEASVGQEPLQRQRQGVDDKSRSIVATAAVTFSVRHHHV